MKTIIAAVMASVLFAAGAAQAAERVCEGTAEAEESGASVGVRFRVDDRSGEIKSREATWELGSASGGLGAILGEPSVSVDYEAPTEQGLGAAARIGVSSFLMTGDGRYFAGAVMVFELPDGRNWRHAEPIAAVGSGDGSVTMAMAIGELTPQTAPDLFADLEMIGQARASFRRGDHVLKGGTVDFRGRAERDQLFQRAWASAVTAAAKPRACKKR